jgi:CheY-like chemotaxis protein
LEVNDAGRLVGKLHNMKRPPDLLLLDLYHPRIDGEDFEQKQEIAEQELAKLDEQIKITKAAVEEVWSPAGLDVLKNIRQDFNAEELPIIIYSQRGLFLLDDEKVRQVDENDAEWLLKRQFGPITEKTRMDRVMRNEQKTSQLSKIYNRALTISWAITAIVLAVYVLPIDSLVWQIAVGIMGGLATNALVNYYNKQMKKWQGKGRR